MQSPADSSPFRWDQWLIWLLLFLGRFAWGQSGHGRARGVLRIILLADRVTERLHIIRSLRADGVLRYEVASLPGRALPLPGQPDVAHGNRVIMLHWNNRAISRLVTDTPGTRALTWQLARTATKDLQVLAEMARAGAFPSDVRAVWVETVIYTSLTRLGFATRPAPHAFRTPFIRIFQLGMIAIYGRNGLASLDENRLRHLRLGEAWLGLDELQRRFAMPPGGDWREPHREPVIAPP